MSFRRILLILHLWAALLAGVFLLALGATGSFMVYEHDIDRLLNRRLVEVQPAARLLSLAEISTSLEKNHPGYKVTDFAFPSRTDSAYQVYLDPGSDAEGIPLAVDPYSGKVLGDLRTANVWVNRVHQFHTHLLMEKHREAAKLIVGFAAGFLLFLSCSGVVLWWRSKLFSIHWRASGKRVNFDLHNAFGFYSSLFLLVFALTGIAINWEGPVRKWVNRLTHAGPEPRASRLSSPSAAASALDPDAIVAAAQVALPGARLVSLSLQPGRPADIRMKFPEDATPGGRSRVLLDPYTGRALLVGSSRAASLGFKINQLWIREIHTGDIFGWPTRLFACFMSLALPIMVITGTMIWWNRNRKLLPAFEPENGRTESSPAATRK
jgi:uncharacterized iron-regulated membrane protein